MYTRMLKALASKQAGRVTATVGVAHGLIEGLDEYAWNHLMFYFELLKYHNHYSEVPPSSPPNLKTVIFPAVLHGSLGFFAGRYVSKSMQKLLCEQAKVLPKLP